MHRVETGILDTFLCATHSCVCVTRIKKVFFLCCQNLGIKNTPPETYGSYPQSKSGQIGRRRDRVPGCSWTRVRRHGLTSRPISRSSRGRCACDGRSLCSPNCALGCLATTSQARWSTRPIFKAKLKTIRKIIWPMVMEHFFLRQKVKNT